MAMLSVDEDKDRNSLLLIDSAIDENVNLRDEFDVPLQDSNNSNIRSHLKSRF